MFTWVRFGDGTSTAALLLRAIEARVAFVPGSAFSPAGRNQDSMRLCFATVSEPGLTEAIRRLAGAWMSLLLTPAPAV